MILKKVLPWHWNHRLSSPTKYKFQIRKNKVQNKKGVSKASSLVK